METNFVGVSDTPWPHSSISSSEQVPSLSIYCVTSSVAVSFHLWSPSSSCCHVTSGLSRWVSQFAVSCLSFIHNALFVLCKGLQLMITDHYWIILTLFSCSISIEKFLFMLLLSDRHSTTSSSNLQAYYEYPVSDYQAFLYRLNPWIFFRMYLADCWWAFGGGIKWMMMERAIGYLSQGR